MQPCAHMPGYERAEQVIAKGSGFARSRKIPLRQRSYMLPIDHSKGKKISALMSDIYIFQLRNTLQEEKERKEARRQQPKEGGDHL